MMNGDLIAPLFSIGPRISAQVLGIAYQQFRPTSYANPTGISNLIATIPAWITADARGMGAKPLAQDKPVAFGMFDPDVVEVGDYLIGGFGTFYVSSMDGVMPMQVVRCNAMIDVLRPASNTGFGAQPYGGDEVSTEIPVLTQWPAFIGVGTKGEQGAANLVGDVRAAWYNVLLPVLPGVAIKSFDIINDNIARRHKISSVELSQFGWRLTVMYSET